MLGFPHMTRVKTPLLEQVLLFLSSLARVLVKNTYSYSCPGSFWKYTGSFWEVCGWSTRCLVLTIGTKAQGNNYLEISLEVSWKFPGSFLEANLRNVAMCPQGPKVIQK